MIKTQDDNYVIKQSDPLNRMWQLFRIWVEETDVPKETSDSIRVAIGRIKPEEF